jgi:hypothetical protein
MDRTDEIYARMILDILRTDLKRVFAWNFQYPKVIKNGVRAFVSGFLYEGYIEITYNPYVDLYWVATFKDDGTINDKEEYIHLERLIDVIEMMIQGCDNHLERIMEWYKADMH